MRLSYCSQLERQLLCCAVTPADGVTDWSGGKFGLRASPRRGNDHGSGFRVRCKPRTWCRALPAATLSNPLPRRYPGGRFG